MFSDDAFVRVETLFFKQISHKVWNDKGNIEKLGETKLDSVSRKSEERCKYKGKAFE